MKFLLIILVTILLVCMLGSRRIEGHYVATHGAQGIDQGIHAIDGLTAVQKVDLMTELRSGRNFFLSPSRAQLLSSITISPQNLFIEQLLPDDCRVPDCKVDLDNVPEVSRGVEDLFIGGFITFEGINGMNISKAMDRVCTGGPSFCGAGEKLYATAIQGVLEVGQDMYENNIQLWKDDPRKCYKDWMVACDNAGWACRPKIRLSELDPWMRPQEPWIEDPENFDYDTMDVDPHFRCGHYDPISGWLEPGATTPPCDSMFRCPYEYQCSQYSDKFPYQCASMIKQAEKATHHHETMHTSQEHLCNIFNNRLTCENHSKDPNVFHENSVDDHDSSNHRHNCQWVPNEGADEEDQIIQQDGICHARSRDWA